MRLLRNPEVRAPLLALLTAAGLILCALAILLRGEAFVGVVLGAVGGAFAVSIAVFLIASAVHAKKVRAFTLKAERNLHGGRELQFDEFKEGDFAVLQNVVQSMAIAHARQEELLADEKSLLQRSLADIAHQIKTPLASLSLTAEQLIADEIAPADRKRAARKILGTAEHISELVTKLLKRSRLDADAVSFRLDAFSAEELIDRVCEPLEISMEIREIALIKDVSPDVVITGDLLWLTEALMNVVKNCIEHTPEGGTVQIEVRDSAVATEILISDTGPGIAEEDLPHLFERYYRGKDANETSVGIGLALTNQVVRALGGTVEAANRPEGGAVFTVRLIKMNV